MGVKISTFQLNMLGAMIFILLFVSYGINSFTVNVLAQKQLSEFEIELSDINVQLSELATELNEWQTLSNSYKEQIQLFMQQKEEMKEELEVQNQDIEKKKQKLLEKQKLIEELKQKIESFEFQAIKIQNQRTLTQFFSRYPSVPSGEKTIFLTFDDGPMHITLEVLEILKEHEVTATFFIVGNLAENRPDIVRKTYNEGHAVLAHTYTHDYRIYTSFDTFYEDLHKVQQVIHNILGKVPPPIFRFAGGAGNHVSRQYGGRDFMPRLTQDVKEKGYYYIEWNVSARDTSVPRPDKDLMTQIVLEGCYNKDYVVALFHDINSNTALVKALPLIITELKERGYVFRTFRDITQAELNKMQRLGIANTSVQ